MAHSQVLIIYAAVLCLTVVSVPAYKAQRIENVDAPEVAKYQQSAFPASVPKNIASILHKSSNAPEIISPSNTVEFLHQQFLNMINMQFPALSAQINATTCALVDVDPSCFLIEYAGRIGEHWETQQADMQEMAFMIHAFLDPMGLTLPAAKLVCSSSSFAVPALTFNTPPKTEDEINAMVASVIGNCTIT